MRWRRRRLGPEDPARLLARLGWWGRFVGLKLTRVPGLVWVVPWGAAGGWVGVSDADTHCRVLREHAHGVPLGVAGLVLVPIPLDLIVVAVVVAVVGWGWSGRWVSGFRLGV